MTQGPRQVVTNPGGGTRARKVQGKADELIGNVMSRRRVRSDDCSKAAVGKSIAQPNRSPDWPTGVSIYKTPKKCHTQRCGVLKTNTDFVGRRFLMLVNGATSGIVTAVPVSTR